MVRNDWTVSDKQTLFVHYYLNQTRQYAQDLAFGTNIPGWMAAELPVRNQNAAKYPGKIAMVAVSGSPNAINGNDPESQADVNAFGQQFDVRYPIAYDPTLDVAQKYLKNGFPTLVMIDRNKKVVWMTSGETAQTEIEKAIKTTL